MVLVHDDDLAGLRGIYDGTVSRSLSFTLIISTLFSSLQPMESIELDAVMLSYLRRAQPKIHEALFDLGKRPNQYYCNFSISYGGSRTRKICPSRLLTMAGVPI